MTTNENNIPHVYRALGEILKSLSVAKNGKLPSNMGSGDYIKAEDLNAEIKKMFVDHNLLLIPNETVQKSETLVMADRAIKTTIVITGTYVIYSLVDSSTVVISGTGDGLATGSAVAANIASTNALKNALLRTFLITEQAVEDSGKQNSNSEESPAAKKTEAAKKPPAKRAVPAGESPARKKVREEYVDTGNVDRTIVNALMKAAKDEEGLSGDAVFEYILGKLEKGEVA